MLAAEGDMDEVTRVMEKPSDAESEQSQAMFAKLRSWISGRPE